MFENNNKKCNKHIGVIKMLKRKIDLYLKKWKENDHNPLIIYGARQIGKTTSIREFAKTYSSFIEINFIETPEYKDIFSSFNVEDIIKRISFKNPNFKFIPNDTLILFDEIQEYMDATTSLKFFKLDGRYDVICTGSALGANTNSISSVSVGFKEEYVMYPLDFEEYLWANGYDNNQINYLLDSMINLKPLDKSIFDRLSSLYREFVVIGGYPKIVSTFIEQNNFSNILNMQKNLYKDYLDDISKYLHGLDISKTQRVFESISAQLAKDNHKFQFSKLGHGARFNEYYGICDWLRLSGTAIISNNCKLSVPLKGNEDIDNFRMYYCDTSLLIASLDSEAQDDLRLNNNYMIYNGALYESLIGNELIKQDYSLYFYKNESATIELDYLIRYKDSIIPIEVKKKNGRAISLKTSILNNDIIKFGIKLTDSNIGKSDNIITLPYFLTFLLKRFLKEYKK